MIDLAIDSRLFISNEIDIALQELDLLFNTENTELLGDTNFGIEVEHFMWNLTPTLGALQDYIENKIANNTFYANKLNPTVTCHFTQGEYRSIYYVQITLTDNSGVSGTRNYRFQ